jgi:hypothetical protein
MQGVAFELHTTFPAQTPYIMEQTEKVASCPNCANNHHGYQYTEKREKHMQLMS